MMLFAVALAALLMVHGVLRMVRGEISLSAKQRVYLWFFAAMMCLLGIFAAGYSLLHAVDPAVAVLRYFTGSRFAIKLLESLPNVLGGAVVCAYALLLSKKCFQAAKR